MKTLEQNFVMNADKCGNHKFTQVRREGMICMYQRIKIETDRLHSVEVFVTKLVKAGSPLPGGGTVAEDYEQYPGASSFGRTAWSTNSIEGGNIIFNRLLAKNVPVVEGENEETELVTVARVTQPKGDRRGLKWPEGPFTQKQLAAFNEIGNYKEVYTDLQRALANGTLKVSEQTHEVNRGRAAKMFEVVNVAQPVSA
jgi:hypothetical protein